MAPDTRKQSMRRNICSLAIACWVCSQERFLYMFSCGCWLSGTFWTSCGWWWVWQVWKTFERIQKQLIDLDRGSVPSKSGLIDVLRQEVFPWKKTAWSLPEMLAWIQWFAFSVAFNFLRVLAKRSPIGAIFFPKRKCRAMVFTKIGSHLRQVYFQFQRHVHGFHHLFCPIAQSGISMPNRQNGPINKKSRNETDHWLTMTGWNHGRGVVWPFQKNTHLPRWVCSWKCNCFAGEWNPGSCVWIRCL